jgi:hypothetical protein
MASSVARGGWELQVSCIRSVNHVISPTSLSRHPDICNYNQSRHFQSKISGVRKEIMDPITLYDVDLLALLTGHLRPSASPGISSVRSTCDVYRPSRTEGPALTKIELLKAVVCVICVQLQTSESGKSLLPSNEWYEEMNVESLGHTSSI